MAILRKSKYRFRAYPQWVEGNRRPVAVDANGSCRGAGHNTCQRRLGRVKHADEETGRRGTVQTEFRDLALSAIRDEVEEIGRIVGLQNGIRIQYEYGALTFLV